ncbi:hypothetical protein [Streptomyces sp. 2132.2]|uniref:hypothetical protein n=1 Tax=Streptomyces sp. 2132.2 TaxID=2485161 RepID=UPI0021A739AD|nr:hypothetical protein [Streptomyces sp. 2132.2]
MIRLEFTPLGAYRLFALPMRELTNQVVRLDSVLGPETDALVERLAATPDGDARFDLLDAVLLGWLARGPRPRSTAYGACWPPRPARSPSSASPRR